MRLLAILSYHKIGAPSRGVWEPWFYVSEATLAEQLEFLRDCGWEIVDLATTLRGLSRPDLLPERSALVTFDDGHRSVLELALPIMAERGCPGTMFVPIDIVGRRKTFDEAGQLLEPICDWDELRELEAGGISIQSHGVSHRAFSELEPRQIAEELVASKALLEEKLEKPIEAFAFPYGDGGNDPAEVTQALQAAGYAAACLYGGGPVVLPGADRYRLSRLAIGADTDLERELALPASPAAG